MEDLMAGGVCAAFGFGVAALMFTMLVPTLNEAQFDYTRCVADGAPRDTCIKNYLLPEEKP